MNILVRLISPILSFTAEEVWQTHPYFNSISKSVFLADEYSIDLPEASFSEPEWRRIFEIKDLVNQAIEEERNQGNIKGSLDTILELELEGSDFDLLGRFGDELHFLFITSECILTKGRRFKANVSTSAHEKCVRCWHRCPSVGKNEKHPEICSRCELNVEGGGEVRQFV